MSYTRTEYYINGVKRTLLYNHEKDTLAAVLRRNGMTGVKVGCGVGQCGACTVLLNGEPVRACTRKMRMVAPLSQIETIEGVGTASNLHPLQKAWILYGGAQCGFCTPGFILSAKSLLEHNPAPTREEVRQWFTSHNNLCRCTGYKPLIDAVMAAAAVMRGEASAETLEFRFQEGEKVYGSKMPRPTALAKVLGVPDYGDDVGEHMPPETLHLAVVWPSFSHANILSIDTAEAEAMPGVERVLTWKDVPGSNDMAASISHKRSLATYHPHRVLSDKKVVRIGDPIAVVVARTAAEAREAAKKVHVDLQVLPEYETYLEASLPDSVQIHEGTPNLCCVHANLKGRDTREVFPEAACTVEASFSTSREPHLSLEPWSCQAYYDEEGRLTIHYKGQSLYDVRAVLSRALGLPQEDIRLISNTSGGSFGYSVSAEAPALAGLAAMITKKPVTFTLSYAEHQRFTGKRSGSFSNGKIACDKDGHIIAMEYDIGMDHGSHVRLVGKQEEKVCRFVGYPYKVPNIRGLSRACLSNNAYGTAYRAQAAPQPFTLSEGLVDMLAEKMGMDPYEFRYINAARPGDTTPNDRPYKPCTIAELMDMLRPEYEEARRWAAEPATPGTARGVGVCCGGYTISAASDMAEVAIGLNPDNTITSYNCWEALGQGSDIGTLTETYEALRPMNVPLERIRLYQNDTLHCPKTGPAAASRSHYFAGNATIDAANKLMKAMRKEDGTYRTYDEMVAEGIPTRYEGSYSTAGLYENISENTGAGEGKCDQNFIVYVACVEVDKASGKTRVERIRSAVDIGVIGNMLALEGQALGGLEHSIGYALQEHYSDHDKKCATMLGCGFPKCSDIPDDIKFLYKETPRPRGPFGSGGASECFQACGHMSVINAIADAVGVRINDLPATPARVKAAMEAKEAGLPLDAEPYYLGEPMDDVVDDIIANPVPETPFKAMTVEEMMIGD